jgi:hypothetical protein
MFTEPMPPLAILIEIGKLHHPPRANQRVGFLGGALGAERVNHFHSLPRSGGRSRLILRDKGQLA